MSKPFRGRRIVTQNMIDTGPKLEKWATCMPYIDKETGNYFPDLDKAKFVYRPNTGAKLTVDPFDGTWPSRSVMFSQGRSR